MSRILHPSIWISFKVALLSCFQNAYHFSLNAHLIEFLLVHCPGLGAVICNKHKTLAYRMLE